MGRNILGTGGFIVGSTVAASGLPRGRGDFRVLRSDKEDSAVVFMKVGLLAAQ